MPKHDLWIFIRIVPIGLGNILYYVGLLILGFIHTSRLHIIHDLWVLIRIVTIWLGNNNYLLLSEKRNDTERIYQKILVRTIWPETCELHKHNFTPDWLHIFIVAVFRRVQNCYLIHWVGVNGLPFNSRQNFLRCFRKPTY